MATPTGPSAALPKDFWDLPNDWRNLKSPQWKRLEPEKCLFGKESHVDTNIGKTHPIFEVQVASFGFCSFLGGR